MRTEAPLSLRLLPFASFILSAALLYLVLANLQTRLVPGARDFVSFGWPALYFAIVGFGLLRLRLWAAILFALPLAIVGLWMMIGSIATVPLPWVLLSIVWSLVLLTPAFIVIRSARVFKRP